MSPIECANCGIIFQVPTGWRDSRYQNGQQFWCPNGHVLIWHETDADRARKAAEARAEKAEAWVSRERLEAAGFECYPNVCRACGHVGGDHSIWNRCLICRCEHFLSMDEDERWEYALAKLRLEARDE